MIEDEKPRDFKVPSLSPIPHLEEIDDNPELMTGQASYRNLLTQQLDTERNDLPSALDRLDQPTALEKAEPTNTERRDLYRASLKKSVSLPAVGNTFMSDVLQSFFSELCLDSNQDEAI